MPEPAIAAPWVPYAGKTRQQQEFVTKQIEMRFAAMNVIDAIISDA